MNAITFLKEPITSQISILCTLVLSGSYDVWGGTHVSNPLKTNTFYITFTAYLTVMHETTCFALQIKRHFSLPTARRSAKFGGPSIWFGNNFTQQRNWSRHSDTLRRKQRNIAIRLGSQNSWGGVKVTCVDLRSVRAVRLNFWNSCGVGEQRGNEVSYNKTNQMH